MEEQESLAAVRRGAVPPVQTRDPLARRRQRVVVARHARSAGASSQSERMAKRQVAVGIREVVHLEPLDLLLDLGDVASTASAPTTMRPQVRRHAVAQLEARQHARRDERR